MTLLLVAASCAREFVESTEPVPSAQDKVPIILSFAEPLTLQASTKAEDGMEMGLNPAIKTIHVAVFGSSGYLKDYASAVPCNSEGTPVSGFVSTNATTGYFKVYLPFDEGPSNRRIHIIANGPSSLPFNAYEDDIMKELTVSEGNGAYWTRFVTDKNEGEGIMIKTIGSVPEQDANGDYVPADKTKEIFQGLKLIRNFAGITVIKAESGGNNFAIDAFTVCNMPSEGRVAIYNETFSEWIPGSIRGVPDSGYAGLSLDGSSLLTYNSHYYPGFPVKPSIDTSVPQSVAEYDAAGVSVAAGAPMFVYERAVTNDTAPFVLIKARYIPSGTVAVDSPTYYYRLDITPGYQYVPLYRNFYYRVKVSGISVEGYDTPGEAARHNSGDNFSVSIDTQDLPSVSNGTTQIFVKETEVDGLYSAGDKDFWYQFYLISNGNYYNGPTGSPAGGATTVTIQETKTGALASWSVAGSDDGENKRHITYTLNEPTTEDLVSVLRITGTYTPDGGAPVRLIRDIKFTVMAPKTLSASFSPDMVGPNSGEQTSLDVTLPGDLPKGIFPLTFKIEDSAKGLNATDQNVSVTPGASIITSDQSYQFVKILNWSEYEELVEDASLSGKPNPVMSVGMKTIKDNTATTAYVSNSYFSTVSTSLGIDNENYISPGTMTIGSAGGDLGCKVFSAGNWLLSIARENGTAIVGTALSVSSGTATGGSGQNVTVTIPENPGTNDRVIVLTLHNTTSDIRRSAFITQKGKVFKLTASETSVKGDGTPVTLSLESDYASWTITDPDGGTFSPSSGGAGTTAITYTPPKNNSLADDIERTVIATNGAGDVTRSVKITQRKAKSTNGSVTFNTKNGNNSGEFTSSTSHTKSNVTATFSAISDYASTSWLGSRNYTTLASGTTLTINTASVADRIALTGLTLTFTNNSYSSTGVSAGGSASPSAGSATSWTGTDAANSTVFTLTTSNSAMRMTEFTVNYTYRTWE